MKAIISWVHHIAVVFIALGVARAQAPSSDWDSANRDVGPTIETSLPDALSFGDWASIRAAHDSKRHAAVEVDEGYEAWNQSQRWVARFDGRGFTTVPDSGDWVWGLETVRWGFAGHEESLDTAATVSAEARRVTYSWGQDLSEWWVNDNRGLEHGYTVHRRPRHADETSACQLTIGLRVRGKLRPEVTLDGLGVYFRNTNGSAVVTYTGLVVFDADCRVLPARLKPTDEGLLFCIDVTNARYPLTIDPIAQQAYLKASNTDPEDYFGRSVAASGETVVVGAPYESSPATGVNGRQYDNSMQYSGAAYVFVRIGTNWSQVAYLKASNTESADLFGWAVAISGDTIVVGAPNEDSSTTGINGNQSNNDSVDSGSAYVFVRSGSTWSQEAYLKASNTDPADFFGFAVAISGNTVVVGAGHERSNATGVNGNQNDNSFVFAGAAYVFTRGGTTWTQQAYLKASNTESSDAFGQAVAVSGDTIVIGALNESSNATGVNGDENNNAALQSGSAYVFVRIGTIWSQQAYLKASNTGSGDAFGCAVAVSGQTIVVGARREGSNATGVDGNQYDNSALDSGAAYVFMRDGTNWGQNAYLKASNTNSGDAFGFSVSVSGDVVVVGAPIESSSAIGVNGNQSNNNAMNSGAAYTFIRSAAIWRQAAYLKASNTEAMDLFGRAVAVSENSIVVGSQWESSGASGVNGNQADNSAPRSGAAYTFDVPHASATIVGTGCGGSASVPALSVTSPRLGNFAYVSLTGASPTAVGAIYAGFLAPVPLVIPPACESYLDPLFSQAVMTFSTDSLGEWTLPLRIQWEPLLAGLSLAMQAVVTSSTSPIGVELSNAVDLVLGY